jgi:hypothetical protein
MKYRFKTAKVQKQSKILSMLSIRSLMSGVMPDLGILYGVLALLIFGWVMVYSSSALFAETKYHDQYYFLKRQIVWSLIGLVFFVAASNMSLSFWQKSVKLFFVGSVLSLMLVLVIGPEISGAKRWIRLGLTFDDARPLVEAAGRKGGRFGREREASTRGGNPNPLVTTAGGNPAVTVTTAAEVTTEVTTVSPAPPSGERKTKKEADSGANNPAVTVTTAAEVTDLPGAPPRLSAWERTTARVSAAEVLFTLRTDGGLRLSAGPVQENELDGVLQGVTPAWTLDGARHLARHIKAEHLRDGWRPSIAHLRGRDGSWTTLLSLYDEAQTCERCARARPATTTSKPAAKAVVEPAKPRLSPEEIRERMSKVTAALQQNEVNK